MHKTECRNRKAGALFAVATLLWEVPLRGQGIREINRGVDINSIVHGKSFLPCELCRFDSPNIYQSQYE